MIDQTTLEDAARLLERCREGKLRLATAESCTGGLIAATLTSIAGSSDVVDRGFVTYSNAAKSDLLGVPAAVIDAVGAVSEEVVLAMAQGALDHSLANIAIAVTGIAGPGGGSDLKPVGLVWFGLARRGAKPHAEAIIFPGDRTEVRCATVFRAIQLMQQAVDLAHRV